jgi:hypothetical protein
MQKSKSLKETSLSDLQYNVKGVTLSYMRSIDWKSLIRYQDFERMDEKMLKIIVPSILRNDGWGYVVSGYKHLIREDLIQRSDNFIYGYRLNSDRINKINFIYDMFLDKYEGKFSVVSQWGQPSHNILALHEAYNNFCKDGDFDSEFLACFGLNRKYLRFFRYKTEDEFAKKFLSIKRGNGYMEQRKALVLSFALRGLEPSNMCELVSQKISRAQKSDAINALLAIRKQHMNNIKYVQRHLDPDNCSRNMCLEFTRNVAPKIVKSCSKLLYAMANGIDESSAACWSNYLLLEDIPFVMPHITSKNDLGSLLRDRMKVLIAKEDARNK